jgi:4-hydroxybenzoate polyprenyltransferase
MDQGPDEPVKCSLPPGSAEAIARPLAVDLDGTLLRSDLMWEGLARVALRRPWRLPSIAASLLGGRAAFKARVATSSELDPAGLPWRADLLDWVRAERRRGRRIVLATAADRTVAERIAAHLDAFDEVLASEPGRNLSSRAKADALAERFGEGGFDYAGDHPRKDWPVFERAGGCVPAGSPRLEAALRDHNRPITASFADQGSVPRALLRAMRVHQWSKNLLVFVPLLTAHLVLDAAAWVESLLAFAAFSLLASGTYLLNDLHDLDADRRHPTKCRRPLASGALSIPAGFASAIVLALAGLAIAFVALPKAFVGAIGMYLVLTLAYSLFLKRLLLVDVVALSLLYTVRIYAGAEAIEVELSEWLFVFSLFVFTSLAFLKRSIELRRTDLRSGSTLAGRGYAAEDAPIVRVVGPTIGVMSVLVLALYVQSPSVEAAYASPRLLWLLLPLMTYWVVRIWFLAERGTVDDDPVAFSIRDRGTQIVVVLMATVALVAWKW